MISSIQSPDGTKRGEKIQTTKTKKTRERRKEESEAVVAGRRRAKKTK